MTVKREKLIPPALVDGVRQALAGLGIKPEEQEEILRIIHRHTDGGNV